MYKQTPYPIGAEQWLINLIDLKNKVEMTVKQISEKENLAEKSVSNVFLGKSKNPGVDLIRRIIHALGGSWREIFGESDAVIGGQDLATLQTEVDSLHTEVDRLQAEVDRLTSENELLTSSLNIANLDLAVQKDKVLVLENENSILKLKLEYEEKLNAVHNFYNKLNSNN